MADSYPIRPVSREEFEAFRYVDDHAFHVTGRLPERVAISLRLFEPERSLAAFDPAAESFAADAGAREGDIVGTSGAFSFQMTVPGGALPVAGVSYVSVLPTYRRRGIQRSLMRRQLTDIAAGGAEPVAALWASEAPLYRKYGYGPAASVAVFRFGRGEGTINAPVDPSLTLRLVSPAEAIAELATVYDATRPSRPGLFARSDVWWDIATFDHEAARGGFGPLRCVLAGDPGGPRGYALYYAQGGWDDGDYLPDSKIVIKELIAADALAGAALWRDLLSRDLVSEVLATNRPADDPLLFQLADPRRARPLVSDGVWVRLVDLPRALASRAYSAPVDVVLEVSDSLLPANAGRWRLRAAGPAGGASCEPTSDPADIALDVAELGAAYLGGTRLGALAAAGLVGELRPGTLGPLSAAMTWDPAPWCPMIF
ncbi:MAG: acetyltransferase [Actinomycetia bacterium]|nr:acetyltransferase [Actinomycetes bacterium]